MAQLVSQEPIAGFEAPVHRAILLAGAPRAVAILNGTVSAAIELGLRLAGRSPHGLRPFRAIARSKNPLRSYNVKSSKLACAHCGAHSRKASPNRQRGRGILRHGRGLVRGALPSAAQAGASGLAWAAPGCARSRQVD
jgi:hypothetical protein